jgi:hypothetical protein
MKHLYTMLGSIGILVLFTGCVAQHTCSSQDMIGMKEKGFGVDEINRLCVTYTIHDEAVQVMSEAVRSELAKPRQSRESGDTGRCDKFRTDAVLPRRPKTNGDLCDASRDLPFGTARGRWVALRLFYAVRTDPGRDALGRNVSNGCVARCHVATAAALRYLPDAS